MLDAIMYIVAAVILPLLVNKTTERFKLEWIQEHIRPLWMIVFTVFTMFFIHRSGIARMIMMIFKKANINPIIQFIIIGFCGAIIFCVYWLFTGYIFNEIQSSNIISTKLILSVRELEIKDPKNSLIMNLLFHNAGNKDFIIENIFMLIFGDLKQLDNNDDIFNNFNNKVNLEYKRPNGKVYSPAGYIGIAAIKSGFPKILKPTDLYPLQVTIPFNMGKFFKETKLSNISKIPIGLLIWIIDCKGQTHEIFACPIGQIKIINDNEMQSMAYRSPTTFNVDIEDSQKSQGPFKSHIIKPSELGARTGTIFK